MQEIYAAEGSDWFWWYGGDFVTDNDLIFDELFRTHLQNVYRICGAPIPDVLKTNICRSEVAREARKPTDLISPLIDGLITSYYEWAGAGVYEAGRNMGAMYRSERCVEAVHFGVGSYDFYLRVDFRKGVDTAAQGGVAGEFRRSDASGPHCSGAYARSVAAELLATDPDSAPRNLRG